jgi:hypothetical protein
LRDEPTPVQKRNPVAQSFGLVHLVARDKDGDARARELPDLLLVSELRGVIQPERGLVQEQQLRPVRHRLYERELLPHPVRVRLHLLVLVLREPEVVEELREHAVRLSFLYPVGTGEEVSVGPAGQVTVVGWAVHHQAYLRTHLPLLLKPIRVADAEGAAIRRDGGREDAQQGALTRAVRTQEAEDLARLDLKAHFRHASPAGLIEACDALGAKRWCSLHDTHILTVHEDNRCYTHHSNESLR